MAQSMELYVASAVASAVVLQAIAAGYDNKRLGIHAEALFRVIEDYIEEGETSGEQEHRWERFEGASRTLNAIGEISRMVELAKAEWVKANAEQAEDDGNDYGS